MDDVLKSLVFADAGGGQLVSVSYDPHPDLAQRVDDIRVSLPEGGGLVALLGQLRGAEVARSFVGLAVGLVGRDIKPADSALDERSRGVLGP